MVLFSFASCKKDPEIDKVGVATKCMEVCDSFRKNFMGAGSDAVSALENSQYFECDGTTHIYSILPAGTTAGYSLTKEAGISVDPSVPDSLLQSFLCPDDSYVI